MGRCNIHQIHGRVSQHLIVGAVGFTKAVLVCQILGSRQISGCDSITVDNVCFLHGLPHTLGNASRSHNCKIIFHTNYLLFPFVRQNAQIPLIVYIIARMKTCARKIQIVCFL